MDPSEPEPKDGAPSQEAIRAQIEDLVSNPFFKDENEDFRNTLRIIAAAIHLSPNADRIARFLGLNRDKFVRPRVQRLWTNGIFVKESIEKKGKVAIDEGAFESDQALMLWFVLAGLAAEGLAFRSKKAALSHVGRELAEVKR